MKEQMEERPCVTLDGVSEGRWLVRTAASDYVIDFDERTVVRTPGGSVDGPVPAELRKDLDPWTLVDVVAARPGSEMVLVGSGISDEPGVLTVRRSTPVVSIEPIGY